MQTGKIPDKYIELAKRLVEMVKAEGCYEVNFEFKPSSDWFDDVKVHWRRGRHDEPAKVHISSQQHEYLDV